MTLSLEPASSALSPAVLPGSTLAQSALEPAHGVFVLGIVLIITSLMMVARGRRRKRAQGGGAPQPSERLEELRQRREVRGDLERLMVDLEEMARRLGAQMDAKARRVEHLLDLAETRLEELRRAQAGGLPPEPTEPVSALEPPPSPFDHDLPGAESTAGSPIASNLSDEAQDLRQRVYALADAGADPGRIASELDEHQGKVELILSLRGAGGNAPG